MLPLCFFAQATISSSVLFFEASSSQASEAADAPPLDLNKSSDPADSAPEGSSLQRRWTEISQRHLAIGVAGLAALYLSLLPSESTAPLGWAALSTLCIVTLSGLHMVWTHVWLFGSGAVLLTGNPTALAVAACLGANISTVWYIALVKRREMQVPGRAMHGWSRWIGGELFSLKDWEGNMSLRIIHSLPTGFFITDLGVHLVPTLVLLQLAAPHITAVSVVLGYLSSRVWSIAITSHHLAVDWAGLRDEGVLRLLKRQPQRVSAYVKEGVINEIYAFEPPAPTGFFTFAVMLEASVALLFLIITLLPISKETRTWIFGVFGASPLATVAALTNIAVVCVIVGGLTIGLGAAIAYTTRPQQPEVKSKAQKQH